MASFPGAALADPTLQGCWRSQHIQVLLSDQSHRDQNGDCVGLYDGKVARSRCHNDTGDIEIVSSTESIAPGQMRVVPLDAATGQPKGPASVLNYRIDGNWLMIERPVMAPAPAASSAKQPVSLKTLSIRVPTGADANAECRPRGASKIRVGRTPVSSLAFTAPAGWEPYLVDPASDPRLGPAVNASFLVGAFVPQGTAAQPASISQLILVLDDVRYGPTPVRAEEFVAVKKRFASELAPAKLTCDQPDRTCAILRMKEGGLVYTELVNVSGRVAMINATVARPQPDSLASLQRAVAAFVEQLRRDNNGR